MKNLFAFLFLTCAVAAQAVPGFSTATIALVSQPLTSVVLGGTVQTQTGTTQSPIAQSFDMSLPTGEFCVLEISARPAPFPQVGTFLVNYKCSYGVSVGKTIMVVPPGNISVKFVEPGTSASTGTFSVTGAATGSPNFALLRMLEVSKAANKIGADQLTGQPTPWEFYNGAFNPLIASQISVNFLPSGTAINYTPGSHQGQTTVNGITYGVHEEVLVISYHPSVNEAQVSNNVNQLGFVRDNTQGPTGTGVTVWSTDFVAGAMIDILALAPAAPASTFPGLLAGVMVVDPTAPLLFVSNATGGCSMKAPVGYETSSLISGYRSQMFRVNVLGIGALSHIDW